MGTHRDQHPDTPPQGGFVDVLADLQRQIDEKDAEIHRLIYQQVQWAARVNEANHEAQIARHLGRQEAAAAICFDTSCLSCARMLEQIYTAECDRDNETVRVLDIFKSFVTDLTTTVDDDVARKIAEALTALIDAEDPRQPTLTENPPFLTEQQQPTAA